MLQRTIHNALKVGTVLLPHRPQLNLDGDSYACKIQVQDNTVAFTATDMILGMENKYNLSSDKEFLVVN